MRHAAMASERACRFTRSSRVEMREMDDVAFLVNRDTEAIYHLNATGAAIWRLLAEPISAEEAGALFTAAYPDTDAADIAEDIADLFREFDRRGLIASCE